MVNRLVYSKSPGISTYFFESQSELGFFSKVLLFISGYRRSYWFLIKDPFVNSYQGIIK